MRILEPLGYFAYSTLCLVLLVLAISCFRDSGDPILPACDHCHQFGMIQEPGGLYFRRCPHCIGQEWNQEDHSRHLKEETLGGLLDVE